MAQQQAATPQQVDAVQASLFATNIDLSCPVEEQNKSAQNDASSILPVDATTSTQVAKTDDNTSSSSLLGAVWKRVTGTVGCYLELWKTRLSSLVVITTAGGYYASGGFQQGSWQEQVGLLGGTFLQAACANSLNEIFEVERDSIMARTKHRPLPTNRISKTHASVQALLSGVLGTFVLYRYTNGLTAALGAANIFFYAGVYTPLKTRHWLNTWVGTVNGSLPPLMGCTAATNTVWHPTGFYMFSSMYLWQISHFMAIAYKCRAGNTIFSY